MVNHTPHAIDLAHLAADAVLDTLPQSVAAAVVLAAHMVGPGPFVAGEAAALSLAVTAVLESAVSDTPAAGLVEVLVRGDDRQGQFVVRHTGAGTPAIAGRLADARQLVVAHGGVLEVDAVAGQQTTVTLTMPLARLPAAHQPSSLAPAAPPLS